MWLGNFQSHSTLIDNWIQNNCHGIQISHFTFNIGNLFFDKPYCFKSFLRIFTSVCHEVSIVSNNLIVTCLGIQSNLKNWTINAKKSCALLDIHKSKLVVADMHSIKTGKIYCCLVFSTKSIESFFWKGTPHEGITIILNISTTYSQQIEWVNGLSQ